MNARIWRLALSVALGLGIVSGLGLTGTSAYAATEPQTKQAPSTDNWGGCWYVVRRGDTLFSIGYRYGVSPYYLAQINGLYNPNRIYAGMTLTVPCNQYPPKPPRPPKPPAPPPCQEATRYLVRPGDNLFRIALNHGTTVNAIRDANDLWGKVLRPGTTLIIPCPLQKLENGAGGGTVPQEEGGAGKGELPSEEGGAGKGELPPATQVPEKGGPTEQPPSNGQTPALPPEPSGSVILTATAIDPASVTVSAGQSVLWINNSENVYTIVSGLAGQPNDQFTSGELPPGATWIHTFDAAGSYSYYINENPTLVGQVTVNPQQ